MRVEFHEAIALLRRAYPNLSPQLQKCAAHMMKHPSQVATLSMRKLAARIEVPPSTMNRLAKAVGFGTYDELRALFRDPINEQPSGYSFEGGQTHSVAREDKPAHPLDVYQPAADDNINTLFDHIDRTALERAVQALSDARTVLVVGMHAWHSTATYLHHMGIAAFGNWHQLVPSSAEFPRLLGALAPEDAVVCIAIEPCAADSIKVAQRARAAGARVIGITDQLTSPLAACSDDNLLISVDSPSIFPSHVSATVLIEVLVGMIAARNERSAEENVESSERSRRAMGEYWND